LFEYEHALKYVKNKDKSINSFILQSLNKTQKIFKYENLPDTVPCTELERILQTQGKAIFTKVNNDFYVLENGGFSGVVDAYNRPTKYTVSNVALNLTKTYTIDKDCILMKNDYYMTGLLPILNRYGALMVDNEISLNTASILSRITMLISAPDDKTKTSAELYINRILNGDLSIIGENGFFDGVRMQTASNQSNYINQLIELQQYYKASFLNEIGLNANFNMKRERLTANEIALNVDNLLPLIDDMLFERKICVDAINNMYDLDIKVDLSSAWKTTHEHADQELVTVETITEDETESETQETAETEDETTPEQTETESETDQDETETESETDQDQTETESETQETAETEDETDDKKKVGE